MQRRTGRPISIECTQIYGVLPRVDFETDEASMTASARRSPKRWPTSFPSWRTPPCRRRPTEPWRTRSARGDRRDRAAHRRGEIDRTGRTACRPAPAQACAVYSGTQLEEAFDALDEDAETIARLEDRIAQLESRLAAARFAERPTRPSAMGRRVCRSPASRTGSAGTAGRTGRAPRPKRNWNHPGNRRITMSKPNPTGALRFLTDLTTASTK